MVLAPGRYATTLNVHSPHDRDVRFHLELALGYSPGGLLAGEQLRVTIQFITPPGGNCFDPDCTVSVTADAKDVIAESDEGHCNYLIDNARKTVSVAYTALQCITAHDERRQIVGAKPDRLAGACVRQRWHRLDACIAAALGVL